jgi:methyl-accepting chemotaxis protein
MNIRRFALEAGTCDVLEVSCDGSQNAVDGVMNRPVIDHAEYVNKFQMLSHEVQERLENIGRTFFDLNGRTGRPETRRGDLGSEDNHNQEPIDNLRETFEEARHRLSNLMDKSKPRVEELEKSNVEVRTWFQGLVKSVDVLLKGDISTGDRVEKLETQVEEHTKLLKEIVVILTFLGGRST